MSCLKPAPHLRSLTWVRERQAYTHEQMRHLFGCSNAAEFEHVLNELLRDNIIRCKNAADTATEAGAEDAAGEYIAGRGDYAFAYVGLLCHHGHLVYVLPKYADDAALEHPCRVAPDEELPAEWVVTLSLLLRVIQKYKSKYEKELTDAPRKHQTPSYLALLVSIVMDYAENGEYRDDEYLIRLNGGGRIMWERTIHTTTPHLQDDAPIYMDTVNRRLVDAEDHFITRLHRVVVKECCHRLQQFGLVQLLNLPMVDAAEDAVERLGDTAYLIHCVEGELGNQFDSRRRRILHLLLDYLKDCCYESTLNDATYTFGSNCFNQVWEDVCRCTLGKDVKELFLISPPQWEVNADGGKAEPAAVQSLKLDMLFLEGDSAYVLDAKYYMPYRNGENACWAGLPGVGDVTKQFLYRQAILCPNALEKIPSRPSPEKAYNAFLMPQSTSASAGVAVQHFAGVTMPLFPRSRVDAFRLAPAPLYEAYLHGMECANMRDALRVALHEKQADFA